jgi:hypothetical protein
MSTKDNVMFIAGLILVAAGLLLNEWFLAALFSPDGGIAGPHALLIWAADIFLVSLGALLLIRRSSLTKEAILVFSGIVMIAAGIIFNGSYVSLLLNLDMNYTEIIIVRIIELYIIGIGALFIVFRKYIHFKILVIAGISTLICFAYPLAYDLYKGYMSFMQFQSENYIRDTHVKDSRLGWKPKASSIGKHSKKGSFNVEYIIDENGFKKVNNYTDSPDFSIYFFGDSLAFGGGVRNEDTFPNIIKNKYLVKEVNIYNAAVAGYGIVQMFQRFLNIEDRIQAGDIVVFAPASEDIERNLKDFWFPYFVSFTNAIPVEDYPYFNNGTVHYKRINLNLINILKLLAFQAPATKNFWRSINKKLIPNTTREAQEMIHIIKERTEKKGGIFILIFLPTIQQCLSGSYDPDISGFDNIDIMHYFPVQKKELYALRFKTDPHWNAKGHEIAAKAIVETLINQNIVDEKYLRK